MQTTTPGGRVGPSARRAAVVALVVLGGLAGLAPAAQAAPPKKLAAALATSWETVLETPTPQNPYVTGGGCLVEGKLLIPFAPAGVEALTCTVKPGTKVLLSPWTSECSTVEPPPYAGTDLASLTACAIAVDAGIDHVAATIDGRGVPLIEVVTGLIELDLPEDDIFGTAETSAQSVGHGWVALLHPLPPGTYVIEQSASGTYLGEDFDNASTLTLVVAPPGGGRR